MDAQMAEPGFWHNNDRAQKHIGKLNGVDLMPSKDGVKQKI